MSHLFCPRFTTVRSPRVRLVISARLGLVFGLISATFLAFGSDDRAEVTISGQFLPPQESAVYTGLTYRQQVCDQLSFGLRFGGASRRRLSYNGVTFTSGGSDVELIGFYRPDNFPGVQVGLGIAYPDVPDRGRSIVGTYDVSLHRMISSGFVGELGLKGIFASDAIVMGTLGFELDAGEGRTVFGNIGLPIKGYNARSLRNGNGIRTSVATFGLRFGGAGKTTFEVAVTNQLGPTTGLSMTPGLGNGYGLRLQVGTKF